MIQQVYREFNKIIGSGRSDNVITNVQWQFLKVDHPRIPTFYALPKIHKSLTNPKWRPVVSGIGAISEKASIFVDCYMHQFVLSLPSYTKDSIHFLQQIDNLAIPPKAIMVTIDVEALYKLHTP